MIPIANEKHEIIGYRQEEGGQGKIRDKHGELKVDRVRPDESEERKADLVSEPYGDRMLYGWLRRKAAAQLLYLTRFMSPAYQVT